MQLLVGEFHLAPTPQTQAPSERMRSPEQMQFLEESREAPSGQTQLPVKGSYIAPLPQKQVSFERLSFWQVRASRIACRFVNLSVIAAVGCPFGVNERV